MFEIGSSLRTAREHRQLQLSDVERATNIRSKYLAALEDEQFDVLPGTAYVKGFLRTYADFLGLDGTTFVEEFNERYAPAELPEATAPVRVRKPRRLVGAWLVVIPLAVGIGLLSWRLASGGGDGGQRRAEIPAPTTTHVRVTTAPTTTAPVAKPTRALIDFV
ncbi:MAG TPA: helix-turn-helix domain-containing protein, partial [Gaiellaceae bacterium]|nr:helix-turn-helix domain-containing protein [Gaiellaceae bacterium]